MHANPDPQTVWSQPSLGITNVSGLGTATLVVTVNGTLGAADVLRARIGAGLTDLSNNGFAPTEFWFGGTGNDTIALDNYGSDLPIEVRGQGGSDTLVGSFQNDRLTDGGGIDTLSGGGGADAIILVENGSSRPYSRDTVHIGLFESRTGGGLADAIVGQTGVAGTGFDVSSGTLANHDVLSLTSEIIAADVTGGNATDSGAVAQHDITNGIVTFKDTGGATLAINQANSGNAITYLSGALTAGQTAAFAYDSDSNGSADSLLLFQHNGGFAPHTLVRLGGLQGATLGTTAANGVVLLEDTTAPEPTQFALTSNGIAFDFAENAFVPLAAAIDMSKNGVTPMAITGVTGSGTAHVEVQTDQTLAATDWVFLQYTGSTTVDSLRDTAGNLLLGDDPALYGGSAEGSSGNNSIDISGLSALVEYDVNGYAGNDTLVGSGGNDFITGGSGADRMTGGAGIDQFQFDQGDSTPVAVNLGGDATLNTGDTFAFTGGADVITDLATGDSVSFQTLQSGYMGSLPTNGLAANQAFFAVRGPTTARTPSRWTRPPAPTH
ncbi:hypothetical protein [Ramlibacter montanisoli]|uniref:Calcium-binding protein n=1 Tax=Ramlibacter montanisoli TaxID=2732512 RepID=A0A849KC43_9BURK|nr:hypothetical protein [Ramlibacter montanisoli]NNU43717.1 hypothetical protein [Ramlibacter montanisoli]